MADFPAGKPYRANGRIIEPSHRRGEGFIDSILSSRVAVFSGVIVAASLLDLAVGAMSSASYTAEDAEAFVERSGYTRVQVVDTDIFMVQMRGCAKSDAVKYEFEAIAPNGEFTEVDVCAGFLKNGTIRDAS